MDGEGERTMGGIGVGTAVNGFRSSQSSASSGTDGFLGLLVLRFYLVLVLGTSSSNGRLGGKRATALAAKREHC